MSVKKTKIKNAYAYCKRITAANHENFPIYLRLFEDDIRNHITAIYAFARTADDISDELSSCEHRTNKLTKIEQQLYECYEGKAKTPIFIALQQTIKKAHLPIEPFLSLLVAFKMDIHWCPFATMDDVLAYSEHSANTIGKLLMLLYKVDNAQHIQLSDHICTGLQIINFLQDTKSYEENGRIYFPNDLLKKFNVTKEDIHNKVCNDSFRQLMTYMVDYTQNLFEAGKPLLTMMPDKKHLQIFIRLCWLGGTEILKKIKINNYDIYSKRPELSRFEKMKLVYKAVFVNPNRYR